MIYSFYTFFLLVVQLFNTKTLVYHFNITEEVIAPDLTNQKVLLVNKQYPGPEIRASPGDFVVVNLYNGNSKNFTMHFHGLDQKGSNRADGVPFVTQYPIPPGGTYRYKINIGEQSGTYWYHAHTSFDNVGAFGPFIVEDRNYDEVVRYNSEYTYDEERTIILSDLFHLDSEGLLNKVVGQKFQSAGAMKSILINGQTFSGFDGVLSDNNLTITDTAFKFGHHILNVEKGRTYRLRFIGATSVGFLSCKISNHDMLIIENDGVLIEPVKTDRIVINSGQRYSAIVKFDKEINNFWAHCKLLEREDPGNGNFIVSYEGAEDPVDLIFNPAPLQTNISTDKSWIFRDLTVSGFYMKKMDSNKKLAKYLNYDFRNNYVYPFPDKVTKQITLDLKAKGFETSVKYVIQGKVFGDVETMLPMIDAKNSSKELYQHNGVSFSTLKYPVLDRLENLDFSPFPGVYQILEGESIEMILQNYAAGDGSCFEHPWHLHGHPFYVLDYGAGLFDENKAARDFVSPSFRDTDTLFRNPTTQLNPDQPCGWKIIRFRANNPGAWLFHCHITYHMFMGMQVVFMEIPKNMQQLLN